VAAAASRLPAARPRSPSALIAGTLLAVPLALAAAVLVAGLVLVRPAHRVVGPPPADLHAEAVTIASASGSTLRGWFVAGRPGAGAVVLLHGVRADRRSMVARARLLANHGFSVLLFDFQAHGESAGDRITFGSREGLDARAAVDFLRARLPGERIGAIGMSLGGAAALLGPGPLPVDALVLEAVYPAIDTAFANRVRIVLGAAAGAAVAAVTTPLFELLMPSVLGVRPDELRPIDHIGEASAALLVASGTDDTRTTIADARALFERAHEPRIFWAVPGARHVDLEAYSPEEYRRRVLGFLVGRLGGGAARAP
jgi:alpha-beta hydrolase superfamily lysophospholipase